MSGLRESLVSERHEYLVKWENSKNWNLRGFWICGLLCLWPAVSLTFGSSFRCDDHVMFQQLQQYICTVVFSAYLVTAPRRHFGYVLLQVLSSEEDPGHLSLATDTAAAQCLGWFGSHLISSDSRSPGARSLGPSLGGQRWRGKRDKGCWPPAWLQKPLLVGHQAPLTQLSPN